MKTKRGASMPVNAETVQPDPLFGVYPQEFDPALGHISHFATCPNAAEHRKRHDAKEKKYSTYRTYKWK